MDMDYDPAPRLPVSRGERSVVLVLSVAFAALLAADFASDFNAHKLGAVFVLAFWLPMLAVHALGHALAARLVGWRLAELGVGFGREVFSFRAGSVRVRVHTLPLEGYALVQPGAVRRARAKRAFVYFGGPLANLVVLGVLAPGLALRWPEHGDGLALIALQSLALTAALGALCTLLPYRASGNPSDGLALLECAFGSEEVLRERLASVFMQEARRLLYDEQPSTARQLLEQGLVLLPAEPQLLGLRGVIHAADGDPQTAYAALEALGPPDARAPALRAELIADAAWAVLLGRDEALLPDAQRAAERACELRPDEPHHEILLGRALFDRARLDEAYARFMSAYKHARTLEQEAQCIAYLALVCRGLQRAPGAVPFADQAARFEAAVRSRAVPDGLRRRVLGSAPRSD